MGATLQRDPILARADAAVRGAVHLARGPELRGSHSRWRFGSGSAPAFRAPGAVSIGAIDSFSTFVIQILLIVLILASDAVSLNLASSASSSSGESSGFDWAAMLLAILLVVVALGIAYALPEDAREAPPLPGNRP